ncbi:hypothetical protein CKO25_00815 [Thiocapsa imhoffii]|uniref:Uncharacterized protein n=1 Tax=Thiocapsa imhoffii TaxID=382777 RepID=A0A9X1B7G2_9GAMM|nr:hypothetical protein [Thiocapsa imhoffii]MBK1643218.1 hypothetical protein [Thiocapsa imhoffii]
MSIGLADQRGHVATEGESISVPTSAVHRLTGHVVNQRDAHDGYINFDANDLAPHLQRISDALEGLAQGNKGDVVTLYSGTDAPAEQPASLPRGPVHEDHDVKITSINQEPRHAQRLP